MSDITEHLIRRASLDRLGRQFASDPTTLLVQEFGILGGQRRVDIAAINGHFHGFEIKSDQDNLERLEGQSEAYSLVFDYLTVICSAKYLDNAAARLPRSWGLWQAFRTKNGEVLTKQIRGAKLNRETNREYIFHLLWRDEMICVLSDISAPRSILQGSKSKMAQYAQEHMSKHQISLAVRNQLKIREDWRHPQLSE